MEFYIIWEICEGKSYGKFSLLELYKVDIMSKNVLNGILQLIKEKKVNFISTLLY